jgi:hypothetical protein
MIPRIFVGLILLGVGLGVGCYGGLTVANRFADPLSAPYQSGAFYQYLQTGRYLVYANAVDDVKATPGDLTVKAPDGTTIVVSAFSGSETQTRSGVTYTAYALFQAPTAGTYDLTLANSGPPRIIVARTLLDTAKSLIRPAVETLAGALVALIGFLVLLRTFTRRWWRFQDTRASWRQAGAEPYPPAAPWATPAPGAAAQPWNTPNGGFSEPPPGGFT